MRRAAVACRGKPARLLRELLEGIARDGGRQAARAEAGMSTPTVSARVRDLSAYHDRTIALLRRYFRMSLEIGRMPSVLGREVFRARVTSYRVQTFEDAVIFVHDVERCRGTAGAVLAATDRARDPAGLYLRRGGLPAGMHAHDGLSPVPGSPGRVECDVPRREIAGGFSVSRGCEWF